MIDKIFKRVGIELFSYFVTIKYDIGIDNTKLTVIIIKNFLLNNFSMSKSNFNEKVNNITEIIKNGTYEEICEVIDMESFVDYYVMNELNNNVPKTTNSRINNKFLLLFAFLLFITRNGTHALAGSIHNFSIYH